MGLDPERGRNVQDLIGFEDSSAARAWVEDAKFDPSQGVIIGPAVNAGFGDARGRICGGTGGCRKRGYPQRASPAQPEERRFGATRSFNSKAAQGSKSRGNLGSITGKAGRCEIRGNSEIPLNRHRQRSGDSGQPGDSIAGVAGRCRNRGYPRTHREAMLEARGFRAT